MADFSPLRLKNWTMTKNVKKFKKINGKNCQKFNEFPDVNIKHEISIHLKSMQKLISNHGAGSEALEAVEI